MSSSPSSSGEPSKVRGQFHSLKGSLVEAVGDVTGSESWKQSGRQERVQGEAEYRAAQTKEYAEGAIDRLGGKKDAVVGAITGDRAQEAKGHLRQTKGETQQDVNNPT
ncbi:mismatched base pair and cruciform DNA recognition protein [Lyophyllum atratum]|nr:mismatched base pair and cruciform DNA recognition protein [Lyophyllum atratum]